MFDEEWIDEDDVHVLGLGLGGGEGERERDEWRRRKRERGMKRGKEVMNRCNEYVPNKEMSRCQKASLYLSSSSSWAKEIEQSQTQKQTREIVCDMRSEKRK